MAEEGRRILQAGQAAAQAVQSFQAGKAGAVRLGGRPVFMDGLIIGMIAGFQAQNPDVRIEQSYGYAPELSGGVLVRALDLAICPLRPEDLPEGLTFAPLLPGRNVIAPREGHPLLRGPVVAAADLQRFPWIAPPASSPLYADLQRVLSTISTDKIRITFSGGSLSAAICRRLWEC